MAELFTLTNFFSLIMLILLQAVLGFDNLLYISLESKRAPEAKQAMVRKLGISIAVILRIVLLFLLMRLISFFQDSLFKINVEGIVECDMNLHAIIVLIGGGFILYTATKEILHMVALGMHHGDDRKPQSAAQVITTIVMMNLVFSFDSILSAMALSDVFIVMATAIITGGVLMILLADKVSDFLRRNRMYEVLGLFVLFVVGIMLVTEGAHYGHLSLFDHPIHAMSKATFYFVIFVLVLTDIVQSRYKKKLMKWQNMG